MQIAILGYGKMGREIEKIALERGHEIVLKVDDQNSNDFFSLTENTYNIEVAIDFSAANIAPLLIKKCFELGIAVASGTTACNDEMEQLSDYAKQNAYSFCHASNFSLGVNIFFAVNKHLARLMSKHQQYKPSIEETHHIHKLDKPSGTAISLAEQLLAENQYLNQWSIEKEFADKTIPVISNREAEVIGDHIVNYTSEFDKISIRHTAKNRQGFAMGAVIAAEFIFNKPGNHTMAEVLGLE